eukprot:scaffold6534_cov132-Isochrysis_galbana.AAC.2
MSPLYFGFFSSCTQPIECSPAPTTGSPRPCTGSQAPAQAPVEQPRPESSSPGLIFDLPRAQHVTKDRPQREGRTR